MRTNWPSPRLQKPPNRLICARHSPRAPTMKKRAESATRRWDGTPVRLHSVAGAGYRFTIRIRPMHGSRLGHLSDRCRAYWQNVRCRSGAGQLSLRRRSTPASPWTGESGAGGSSELVTISAV